MNEQNMRWVRALAYAFCIIVGYIMFTPKGPVPINTMAAIAVISIVIGIFGLIVDVGKVGQKA
ncbi:Uncharacterised protein [uncultured archaeon]|nr:Uncharacterised protein [uncultured archaeon]